MRRLLFLILALAWCNAGAATYQFTDPSAALTAIPTMTSSDTMQLGCTLAGPITLSKGTYDILPGYSWGVTSAETGTTTGTINASGGVTVRNGFISNTSSTTGRCLWLGGYGSQIYNMKIDSITSGSAAVNFNSKHDVLQNCKITVGSNLAMTGTAGGGPTTIIGNALKGTGVACSVAGQLYVANNAMTGFSVGVSITTGTYANNLFYNVTAPVTGASATFMTNSAWNGDVSTWGAGCVSISSSPWRMTPNENPWSWVPGPWFPGNFAAVSIAGVTDQPSIIGIPTGSTIGAVPYLPMQTNDESEEMIRDYR